MINTYEAPRSDSGDNVKTKSYNDDNQISMIRVNEYVLAVKVGAPRVPFQRRFLNQYGFIIFSKPDNNNSKVRALLIDILLSPANQIVSILNNTMNIEIAGILLTHRHVLYLSNQNDVNDTLRDAGYPNKTSIYLHCDEHKHKDSLLFKYNDNYIQYKDILTCDDIHNEFDLEIITAGCHTEGSVLIYHKLSDSLIVGDLALANTHQHSLLSESTPFYLSDNHKGLIQFWNNFDSKNRYKNMKYFCATHGEPIDLIKEKLSVDDVLKPLRDDVTFWIGDPNKLAALKKRVKSESIKMPKSKM